MPFNQIIIILCLLLSQITICEAQSFYKDTTNVVSLVYTLHEGFDYSTPALVKESVYLDSMVKGISYYKYHNSGWYRFRHELNLRVENKRVYLSGSYRYSLDEYHSFDTSVFLSNYLLYDFNLAKGDTFWFKDPFGFGIDRFNNQDRFFCSGNDSFYVVTKANTAFDTITGDSFYTQECYRNESGKMIASSQFGSSIGFMSHINLIEANLIRYLCLHNSPLICCVNSNLIFENVSKSYNGYLTKYFKGDLCDSKNIATGYEMFLSTGVKPKMAQVQLTPNPVVGILNIVSETMFQIRVLNSNGEMVKNMEWKKEIDMSEFPPGVYTILLSNHKQWLARKVVKI